MNTSTQRHYPGRKETAESMMRTRSFQLLIDRPSRNCREGAHLDLVTGKKGKTRGT